MHVEAAVVFVLALFAYQWNHASWLYFGLLCLAGSFDDRLPGQCSYWRFDLQPDPHLRWPSLSGSYSLETGHGIGLSIGLIWIAHIGLDRMLGFGVKYPTGFKDTHLSAYRHVL